MAQNYDAHPLFPAKSEDDEPPEVLTIQIYRREGSQNVLIPRRFLASELEDEQYISDMYGGGVYELVARNASRITMRRGIQLPGPSKPLFDTSAVPQAPAAAPVDPTAALIGAMGAPPWWVPLISALAPVGIAMINNRAESERRAQEAHQALMATMMTNAQNANTQIVSLLTNMRSQTPNGAEFKEGMNFMQEMLAGQLEQARAQQQAGTESDDISKTIEQITQAMNMISMFQGQSKQPSTVPTEPPNAG